MFTCPSCGKNFYYPGTFDSHRKGDHAARTRHCMDTETMKIAGFTVAVTAKNTEIWHAPKEEGLDLNKIHRGNADENGQLPD